jgi:hypothetical protein
MSFLEGWSLISEFSSALMQSKAMSLQAGAEASLLRHNAGVLEAEANATTRKAFYDEMALRRKVRSVVSTQKARHGASGVVISTGSPVDVVMDSLRQGEMDAIQIREEGWYKASSLRERAGYMKEQAKFTESATSTASTFRLLSGLGSTIASGYSLGIFTESPLKQKTGRDKPPNPNPKV